MKHFHSLLAAVSAVCTLVSASPVQTTSISTSNPFKNLNFFVSPVYREEVLKASLTFVKQGKWELASRATYVATKVGTFLWVSDTASVPDVGDWLKEATLVEKLTGKKQ
ncbi:hypothetical protein FRC17_011214, partial [Serendipita sp. 399]